MSDAVKRRSYDASGRRRRAQETRRRILDVARQLFVESGFAATTMAEIASAADVSVETVYAGFGTKSNLLKVVWDVTIAGDDEPVPIMERPALRAVRAEPDPERALRRYAAFVAETAPRTFPVMSVVLLAAASDGSIAELAEELAGQRLTGMAAFAHQLAESGRLAISEADARDLLWTLNSAQVYDLLVVQRGWPLRRFEEFLGDTWTQTLLRRREDTVSTRS